MDKKVVLFPILLFFSLNLLDQYFLFNLLHRIPFKYQTAPFWNNDMGRKSNSAQLDIGQWTLIHKGERTNASVEVSITFLVSASVGYTSKVNGKLGIQMVAAYLRQVRLSCVSK